jgi:dolichol-phosphate mannosyltransferase
MQASSPESPRLTIVVPTFNERDNIAMLVKSVDEVLRGKIAWEIVFVDDNSPDGTAEFAKKLSQTDPRVRCIRRINRRGLSGACIEGMLSSSAPYIAVMDADLQHDESILPTMLERLTAGDVDIVVGSRLGEGGSAAGGLSAKREMSSRIVASIVTRFFPRGVTDVLSGFFMIRREAFDVLAPQLEQSGFKILADILITSGDSLRVAEIGFTFRARQAGVSKLDSRVVLDFAGLLINKLSRGIIPVRFIFFGLVGASGVFIHILTLRLALITVGLSFAVSQSLATIVAMTWNFYINNEITYRDSQLKGVRFLQGLLLFYLVCGVGAVANVGMANWLFMRDPVWWIAGLAGAAVGAIWNYALSSSLVWKRL